MSVSRKYSIYAVGVGTAVLGGITQQNVALGSDVQMEPTDAAVFGQFVSLVAQNPQAGFSTYHIASALDAVALAGQDISALTGGLVLYANKHAAGGTRASGASHRSYTVNEGLVVPRTLSADHQGNFRLAYQALPIYDGTNDPYVVGDSATLPTAATDDERFTIGGVTIGGVALTQLRTVEIDFGVRAVPEGADSDIWPTFVSIEDIMPKITLRGIDPEWFKAANIPMVGKPATHANTTIYLRKRAQGGSFVADATEEHIALTAAGMVVVDDGFNGTGAGAAEATAVLTCRFDGTNDPITIDTTAAIV